MSASRPWWIGGGRYGGGRPGGGPAARRCGTGGRDAPLPRTQGEPDDTRDAAAGPDDPAAGERLAHGDGSARGDGRPGGDGPAGRRAAQAGDRLARARCGTVIPTPAPPPRGTAGRGAGRPVQPCRSDVSAARLATISARQDGDGTNGRERGDAAPGGTIGTAATPAPMRPVALVGSRPARRVLRWLGAGVVLVGERERSWASAAFVGARHRLELAEVPGLSDTARGDIAARLAELAEADLKLPDAFVAEARVLEPGVDGSAADRMTVELLVIEAR